MKNFSVKESCADFNTNSFSIIYSFNSPEDQLVVSDKQILD